MLRAQTQKLTALHFVGGKASLVLSSACSPFWRKKNLPIKIVLLYSYWNRLFWQDGKRINFVDNKTKLKDLVTVYKPNEKQKCLSKDGRWSMSWRKDIWVVQTQPCRLDECGISARHLSVPERWQQRFGKNFALAQETAGKQREETQHLEKTGIADVTFFWGIILSLRGNSWAPWRLWCVSECAADPAR